MLDKEEKTKKNNKTRTRALHGRLQMRRCTATERNKNQSEFVRCDTNDEP